MDTSYINTHAVVLIADTFDKGDIEKELLETRKDLEKSSNETVQDLIDTIKALKKNVIHYETPEQLAKNAHMHKNDTVLSIYGGSKSRNRMALIPAICETYGLSYIGPDVYGRIIAQDKEISKRLAKECGLLTPNWVVIRSTGDFRHLKNISYPSVVKPLMEGSSIGIAQSNLVINELEANHLVGYILKEFKQPAIVEEFIPGRETALCVIEKQAGVDYAYSEITISGKPDFFKNRLFDVNEKNYPTKGRSVANIDNELNHETLDKMKKLLKAFGRYGYCRIDGRHNDNGFYFLEITPDAWINRDGQFSKAFTEKGWTYTEVIQQLLASKS
jgi:D-alanine-D-alanine ligase